MTAQAPAPRPRLWLVFPSLMLVLLLASLDQTIVATALPTIAAELGAPSRLPWIVTAYLLTTTVVTPIYGKLGDLYGRKAAIQAAILLFLLGSALCGLSRSLVELVVFRGVQGLGGGGLIVSVMAAVGDIVSPRERPRYSGLFGATFGLATVLGPLIGGFFIEHLNWRWIFYVNLPLGLLAFAIIGWTLSTPQRRPARIDVAGGLLLTFILASTVLATDLGPGVARASPAGAIAGGVLLLAAVHAFLKVEQRAAEPVIATSLFRIPVFTLTCAIGFMVGMGLFGSIVLMPVYLQLVKGASPSSAGLHMTPMMAGVLLTSVSSGQVISRYGRYRPFPILGTAFMTAGLFLLSRLTAQTPILVASAYMLLLGLGLGLVMQVLVVAAQNAVPYAQIGVATSSSILARSIGGTVGIALFGGMFSRRLGIAPGLIAHAAAADPATYARALHPVFETASGIAALAFVLTLFLKEIPLRTSRPQP